MAEFEKEVQDLIYSYYATGAILNDKIKAIIEEWKDFAVQNDIDQVTLKSAVTKQINEVKSQAAKTAAVFNQKLKVVIEKKRKELTPKSVSKSADYAARISNALDFLKLHGSSLDDKAAFMILKDFTDDIDTMKLFKGVVERQVGAADFLNAESMNFPLTFAKLLQVESLFNIIDGIELFANKLFLWGKLEDKRYFFADSYFSLTRERYEELHGEQNIIRLAKTLDTMIAESAA